MTSSGPRRAARLLALTLAPVFSNLVLASPALAAPILAAPPQTGGQDNDAARPTTGGLDGFSLSPSGTTPQATQTPVPTPPAPRIVLPGQSAPAAPPPAPPPRATPSPRATPRPAPSPTPNPVAVPAPIASPEPPATRLPDRESPAPPPSEPGMDGMTLANGQDSTPAIAAPGTTAPEQQAEADRGLPFWALLIGVGLGALAIGIWLGRRGRPVPALPAPVPKAAEDRPEPMAAAAAVPAPPVPSIPRQPAPPPLPPEPSFLAITAKPLRVGLNMLSATIEAEVTVHNSGATPIGRVAVDLRLLSAHAGLDGELVELARQPQGRPIVPAFALAPGETRTVRGVTALPREAIHVIDAAGRPMFVPILAAAAHTDWGVARCAYAIGLERVDSAKLSPIWLDQPGRMFDQVAARPHVMKG